MSNLKFVSYLYTCTIHIYEIIYLMHNILTLELIIEQYIFIFFVYKR